MAASPFTPEQVKAIRKIVAGAIAALVLAVGVLQAQVASLDSRVTALETPSSATPAPTPSSSPSSSPTTAPTTTPPPTTASPTTPPSPTGSPLPTTSPVPTPTPTGGPVALPGPNPVGPGGGVFSVFCTLATVAKNDPIVFPGITGAAHVHSFFGAANVNASTTVADLHGMPTTCAHKSDHAAYWVPTLVDNQGQVVYPYRILAYYQAQGGPVRAFPPGLVMIAGGTDLRYFGFSCLDTAQYYPLPIDCPANLLMHVVFPNCWDGVSLDSYDHRSHMAYGAGGKCPAGYPVRVPKMSIHLMYRGLKNGGQGYRLAPNNDGSTPGIHGDFMNGWDPGVLENIVRDCLNPGHDCKVDTTIGT